jgi:DNA topoisomerase IB
MLPGKMKLKDLRTIHGTQVAVRSLKDVIQPPPLTGNKKKDKALLQKALRKASVAVAAKLNNTPSVAATSYVHPDVFKDWAINVVGVSEELWEAARPKKKR